MHELVRGIVVLQHFEDFLDLLCAFVQLVDALICIVLERIIRDKLDWEYSKFVPQVQD